MRYVVKKGYCLIIYVFKHPETYAAVPEIRKPAASVGDAAVPGIVVPGFRLASRLATGDIHPKKCADQSLLVGKKPSIPNHKCQKLHEPETRNQKPFYFTQ